MALCCAPLVIAQDIWPGLSWYHSGAYAGALFAMAAFMLWTMRRYWRALDPRAAALSIVAFGGGIVALAGLASSLLAPDTQIVIRGPGESVPLSDPAGVLVFPMAQPNLASTASRPILRRATSQTTIPERRRRYLASFILWTQPRLAAYVQAYDLQDRHLTLTQPQNTSFLSPVLLFRERSSIGGKDLPVDAFAVPAAHRSIKAVLFRGGILFAVEDERGQLLPGAIKLAQSGQRIETGGIRLQANLATYPAVVIASAPYIPLLIIGLLVMLVGCGLMWRSSRAKAS